MNKIIYKTIGLALFVTCITSLSVPVTSVFIHGKADSPSETVSKTFEKSNLEEITEISFNKDSIVWSKKANNKKSVSSIDLEYNFYMFDSGNTYYYAADLSDDTSELINFSLESNRNGDILNVAFYNRQEKKYTYYYNIADVSLADRIKQKAVPLSYADENLKTTICSSVNWFFDLNGETEVTQTEDRKTYSPETLRATLETYLADRSARRQRIETEKKTGKEKRFFGNAENSQEKTEIYSVSAQSEDDDIVFFIPREYFTSAGRRVGSVSGTMSYYINTVEWPNNSNRFLSEILLWSNFIETYPNYERDLFSFKVTPELSATFDYALNGFSPTGTMSDVVRDLNIATDLALKNIEIEVEIDPINSYYLNGTFYDYDEYFYSMLSESFGQKKEIPRR